MRNIILNTPLNMEPQVKVTKMKLYVGKDEDGKDKYEEFDGRAEYDPIKVSIQNEINPLEWLQRAYSHNHPIDYKVNITGTYQGKKYIFYGVFPIDVPHNWKELETTLIFDKFEEKV